MGSGSLYDRVFESHLVREFADGTCQLYVGIHYVNDVTSSQAFDYLKRKGLKVARPDRTIAVLDHVVPERSVLRPFLDSDSERLAATLEENAARYGLPLLAPTSGRQGIVHVVGPELGITQPGMVVCCGDSHTSAHGALGAIGIGVGTSQIRDVLVTQSVLTRRLNVRKVVIDGALPRGVGAKDVAIALIRLTGPRGGIGLAYEYVGSTVVSMSMDERFTLCAMSIEGGAQVGYVCPDDRAIQYVAERAVLTPDELTAAKSWWSELGSDQNADYFDEIFIDARQLAPMVTWGLHSGQSIEIDESLPEVGSLSEDDSAALEFMGLTAGKSVLGSPVDVAFIGSCANGRLADIEVAVEMITRTGMTVAPGVRALITPGSEAIYAEMERRGWASILMSAGFTIGRAGCALCVGMNGSPLTGNQLCVSTSTRNFKGRQGSPNGRTMLMSPAMTTAAALAGELVDVRDGWVR